MFPCFLTGPVSCFEDSNPSARIRYGRVFDASIAVQEGFSTLSERVQENFAGIRTVQALVQEESEIRRFAVSNHAYASDYERLIRMNSLIAASSGRSAQRSFR